MFGRRDKVYQKYNLRLKAIFLSGKSFTIEKKKKKKKKPPDRYCVN